MYVCIYSFRFRHPCAQFGLQTFVIEQSTVRGVGGHFDILRPWHLSESINYEMFEMMVWVPKLWTTKTYRLGVKTWLIWLAGKSCIYNDSMIVRRFPPLVLLLDVP